MWSLNMCQFCQKFTKREMCQVKVGLNMAQNRLHMLSLFMPVHVKSLPKVKFIQIFLKIVPNLTFKDNEVN